MAISRQEKIIVAILIAIFLALFISPVVYGKTQEDKQFSLFNASLIYIVDYPVYLSQIEQARQGHIFFKNLYTTEAQNDAIFSPLWLVMGWTGWLTGLSNAMVYWLFHLALIVIFLWLLYLFICWFFDSVAYRLTAYILTIFSSGYGALFLLFNPKVADTGITPDIPYDYWVHEYNTFFSLFHSPLAVLSLIFLVLIFYLFLKPPINRQRILILGLLGLFLAISHPYDAVTVMTVLGVYLIFARIINKRWDWPRIWAYCLMGLFSALTAVYYLIIFKYNSAIGGWAEQNITPTPSLLMHLLGYGLVFILAVIGAAIVVKNKQEKFYFLLIWGAVILILSYLPTGIQRRFINGWHIDLCLLGALGLIFLTRIIRKKSLTIIVVVSGIFLLSLFLTNESLLVATFYRSDHKFLPFMLPRSYEPAGNWLKENVRPEEIILSDTNTALLIPGFSGRLVYAGHMHQTVDSVRKFYQVDEWFFKNNSSDPAKQKFLQQEKIGYVVYSQWDNYLRCPDIHSGCYDPEKKNYLEKVYDNQEVQIYRVK